MPYMTYIACMEFAFDICIYVNRGVKIVFKGKQEKLEYPHTQFSSVSIKISFVYLSPLVFSSNMPISSQEMGNFVIQDIFGIMGHLFGPLFQP